MREPRRFLVLEAGAQDLHPWPECRRPFAFVTPAADDARAAPTRDRRQLVGGPRFTDARLADEEHEPTHPALGVGKTRMERPHRSVTTDERRVARRGRRPVGTARRRLAGPRIIAAQTAGDRRDAGRAARDTSRAAHVHGVGRGRVQRLDDGDEAVPAAVHRLNHTLAGSIVVECFPRRRDATREHRFAHELPGPESLEQLVLRHDPVAALDEVAQHVEYFRLELHQLRAPAQLEKIGVESEVAELVDHRAVKTGASLDQRRARRRSTPRARRGLTR